MKGWMQAPLVLGIAGIFSAAGSTITGGSPEQFHGYWKSELAKYGKLVKEAGIKPESRS